ncbi:MAG: hypothetical protein ACP5NP_03680 [Acetobacteraceae bacterium]
MKKGESPKLSAKWWKDSQPLDPKKKPLLSTAGKLEDALKDYEAAKAKLEKERNEEAGTAAKKALDAVGKAVDAASSEAGKIKGNDEATWTVAALKQLSSMIDSEGRWIAENADEEDGMFSDPDVYRMYLRKMLKRMKSAGEMNFGAVLGKKPEDHRIAFHKSKSGRPLASQLAKETGLHVLTFGIAITTKAEGENESGESESTDGEDDLADLKASTLILDIKDKIPPGLGRKLSKMLKRFKVPFKSVVLKKDGKEVADEVDPNDEDKDDYDDELKTAQNDQTRLKELTNALAELMKRIPGVTDQGVRGDLIRLATQARAMLGVPNLAGAEQAIEALRKGLAGANDKGAARAKAGEIWKAAHGFMVREYDRLGKALEAAYQQDGIGGDLSKKLAEKVKPVLDSLNGDLSTTEAAKLIGEYKSFIGGSTLMADLDDNPFAALAVRDRLSDALGVLEKTVA